MMLKISSIKTFFDNTPLDCVSRVFFAVNDQNAAKRLGYQSTSGVQLCIVYPTSSGEGGNDNCKMTNRITMLVLEKSGAQADTSAKEFERFERLQNIVIEILDKVGQAHSDGVTPFCFLRQSETLIEPIYNLAGYDGWGIDLYI